MWQKPLQYFLDLDFVLSTLQSDPSATGWDSQIIPLRLFQQLDGVARLSPLVNEYIRVGTVAGYQTEQHKGERLASEISCL